ncbi:unnamed protein product, partial [Mesorhabditis spiculigera]
MTMCRDNGLEGTTVHSEDENQHLSLTRNPTWSYNNTNYYLITPTCVSGSACTLTCTQNKLQLTTIHSAKEQAKLSQKIAQLAKCASVMIGMANVIAGTRYRNIWRDGSAVDYTYWANGEPSYIIPHEYTTKIVPENCTVMAKDGRWNDVICPATDPTTMGACVCMKRC